MITLKNNDLTIEISELGAQLHSIKRQGSPIEYLWQGAADSWGRQAPILFPFVGRLKDDQYRFKGRTYHQTQHGFARDRNFTVVKQSTDNVLLEQRSSADTLKVFPFSFVLRVSYRLTGSRLDICYQVVNPADHSLLYAIGAHPGFNLPLSSDGHFENVQFSVQPAETYSRIVLKGPYNDSAHPQLIDMHQPLKLNHDLFDHDAIIFDTAGGDFSASLTDLASQHGVTVSTKQTKYVGLWSAYPARANFACIEPWWGIADNVDADGLLLHKQGMTRLAPHQQQEYKFSIRPF